MLDEETSRTENMQRRKKPTGFKREQLGRDGFTFYHSNGGEYAIKETRRLTEIYLRNEQTKLYEFHTMRHSK